MNFLKKISLPLFAVSALFLSGCLNIFEEITLKKNGSGHYEMRIDMSQMKEMMAMLKGMSAADSTGEGEDPGGQLDQMGAAFTSLADAVKDVRGLSNVMAISDTATFEFGYKFDFADVDALNRAVKKIAEQGDSGTAIPDQVFLFKKGKFSRADVAGGMVDDIMKNLGGGGEGDEADQMKMMFADMTATTTYIFPDQKVKKQNHSFGKISEDGHTISIEMKPFAEGADLKKMGSGIEVKVK